MNAPDRDEEFEAFLERRTLLPDNAGKLEPPAEIDERILAEAREAIRDQRQNEGHGGGARNEGGDSRPTRAARWARPMALAATILLCLSIVLNIALNTKRPAVKQPDATVASADRSPVPALAPAPPPPAAPELPPSTADGNSVLEAPASVTASADAARPMARKPTPLASARQAYAGSSPPTAAAAPESSLSAHAPQPNAGSPSLAAPAAPVAKADEPALEAPEQSTAGAGSLVAAERPRSNPAPVGDARAAAAAPAVPMPSDTDLAGAPGSSHPRQSAERAPEETARQLSALKSAKQASPSASARSSQQSGEPSSANSTTAPANAVAAASVEARQPADLVKSKTDTQPPHPQDPKVWLRQIETLRSQGKTAQADAEMQRFRAAFPTYPVTPNDPGTR